MSIPKLGDGVPLEEEMTLYFKEQSYMEEFWNLFLKDDSSSPINIYSVEINKDTIVRRVKGIWYITFHTVNYEGGYIRLDSFYSSPESLIKIEIDKARVDRDKDRDRHSKKIEKLANLLSTIINGEYKKNDTNLRSNE